MKFMSDGYELEDVKTASTSKHTAHQEANVANARDLLNRYLNRAVQIITELAETSENDRVRLAAAESIADRAGLGKSSTTQVQVNQGEHEAARNEAAELVARIEENQRAIAEGGVIKPDLDVLIVHEGESVEVGAS